MPFSLYSLQSHPKAFIIRMIDSVIFSENMKVL
jgi:hypothetical protein